MYRQAFSRRPFSTLGSSSSATARCARRSSAPVWIVTSATLVSYSLYHYSTAAPLLADSPSTKGYEVQSQLHGGKVGSIAPAVFLWGRNSSLVVSPTTPGTGLVKKPLLFPSFSDPLRALDLAASYGVAVDAAGDVLVWGAGSSTSEGAPTPRKILVGKDVVQVACAEKSVWALRRNGQVLSVPVGDDEGVKEEIGWYGWVTGRKETGLKPTTISTDVKLQRGERIISLSTGDSHLLALTSKHRSFALPLSPIANQFGQLGVRRVTLASGEKAQLVPDMELNELKYQLPAPPKYIDPLLLPPSGGDQVALAEGVAFKKEDRKALTKAEVEEDGLYSTTLSLIPALSEVPVKQLVAGANHSLALTTNGLVLGFGCNSYGQLGLGPSLSYPSIPTPTEIPLVRSFPKATRINCAAVGAGGSISYFVVEREDIGVTGSEAVDLLATGNGQFGGMGNATWAHAATPVRVKTVSGLREWSEKAGRTEPIGIRSISVGKTHIAAVLDNAVEQPGGIKFGRDVFVWGHNEHYQLGTGRRSNLASPQHLSPLPYPGLTTVVDTSVDTPPSGTLSPMPHSRLQLAPEIKVKGRIAEETIVAGDSATGVYWRILNP
ncbi:mitochondrial protein [Pseudohyphozyma bogoriensis]|nr:mitochondrial protein [Pseudohyphozyma bogoriensis]